MFVLGMQQLVWFYPSIKLNIFSRAAVISVTIFKTSHCQMLLFLCLFHQSFFLLGTNKLKRILWLNQGFFFFCNVNIFICFILIIIPSGNILCSVHMISAYALDNYITDHLNYALKHYELVKWCFVIIFSF